MSTTELLSLDEISEILYAAEETKRTHVMAQLEAEVSAGQAEVDALKKKQSSSHMQCEADRRQITALQAQRNRAESVSENLDLATLERIRRSISSMTLSTETAYRKHSEEHRLLTEEIGRRCIKLSELRDEIQALRDPNYIPDVKVPALNGSRHVISIGDCRLDIQNIWFELPEVKRKLDTVDKDTTRQLILESFRGRMALKVAEMGGANIWPAEKTVIIKVNEALREYAMAYFGHVPEQLQDGFKSSQTLIEYAESKQRQLNACPDYQPQAKPLTVSLSKLFPQELVAALPGEPVQ